MSTPNHMQTKTLAKVVANAKAITGIGNNRVSVGFTNFADSYDWEAAIKALTTETQGWFSCWLLNAMNMAELEAGTFQIAGELAVYIPPQASTDMVAAWDFALSLVDKLLAQANYSDGEAKPSRISVVLHKVLSNGNEAGSPGVAIFDFGAYGQGAMEFVDP